MICCICLSARKILGKDLLVQAAQKNLGCPAALWSAVSPVTWQGAKGTDFKINRLVRMPPTPGAPPPQSPQKENRWTFISQEWHKAFYRTDGSTLRMPVFLFELSWILICFHVLLIILFLSMRMSLQSVIKISRRCCFIMCYIVVALNSYIV